MDTLQREQIKIDNHVTIDKHIAKIYDEIGVNCDILTMPMLTSEIREKQMLKLQLAQKKTQQAMSFMMHYGAKLASGSKGQQNQYKGSGMEPMVDNNNNMNYLLKKKNEQNRIKPAINKQRQMRNWQRQSPIKTNYSKTNKIEHRQKNPQIQQCNQNKRKHESDSSNQFQQILNKLDVSQYSDMFHDDQDHGQSKKIVCKVQTIIEVGGLSSARLELYNIQLYENNQIRIVSLYGREFEKHQLISMKALKHGYYELKLRGGKVDHRKVKFREPFQPFLKFLQRYN